MSLAPLVAGGPTIMLHTLAARRGAIGRHRRVVIGLFCGALLIAGFFAFAPGRIMHAVVFGS